MYTLLVTGDVPGASTYFNPLLQQTVVPCLSSSRPSSPPTGMVIYETDTNRYARRESSTWVYLMGSRETSFTPTLQATTTNPTIGTGAVRSSYFVYLPGPQIEYHFFVKFGTSGVAAGSGNYQITLPVNSTTPLGASAVPATGAVSMSDSSASAWATGTCFIDPASPSILGIIYGSAGGFNIVNSGGPWAWAASDYIAGTITYPV
jgi:hypothetical protein